jgi:hypothetical protein
MLVSWTNPRVRLLRFPFIKTDRSGLRRICRLRRLGRALTNSVRKTDRTGRDVGLRSRDPSCPKSHVTIEGGQGRDP